MIVYTLYNVMFIHILLFVLQWLEKDFLGYLDTSVSAKDGVSKAEKASMTLSKETVEGLRLIGIIHNICNYMSMFIVLFIQCTHLWK